MAKPGTAGANASRPSLRPNSKISDWYEVGRQLHMSRATGAEVFASLHKPTAEVVAMKAADRVRLNRNYAQSIALYSKLHHPHICECLEVFDGNKVIVVMEAIDGVHLSEFMEKNGLSPSESQQVMYQLASAMAYMHSNGVCHRNLSLDNVLLARGPRCDVKVIDLGACGPSSRALTRKIERSTVVYTAPELFNTPLEYLGAQTDVWSLGVMMYVLLTGKFPFVSEAAVKEGKLDVPAELPSEARDLLTSMLQLDPAARLTADGICQHPWIVKGGELAGSTAAANMWAAQINPQVLEQMEAMGAPAAAVRAAVEEDVHNEITTTYYLLEKRLQREENEDPATAVEEPPPEEPLPVGETVDS